MSTKRKPADKLERQCKPLEQDGTCVIQAPKRGSPNALYPKRRRVASDRTHLALQPARRAVSDLTLDKLTLTEAAKEDF